MTEVCTTGKKKRIFVVDDDEIHLDIARQVLQGDQFEVITHLNGFGMLSRVRTLQPDIVLIDVNMPGLSGDRLAALLHADKDTTHIPIVFYSSNDEDTLREIILTCDVRGYICKGDVTNLRNKVCQYLNMPLPADAKDRH